MERRNFVKSTILGGLGISIFSLDAYANDGIQSKLLKKNVIASENHIRHGLFNPSVGRVQHFNSWLTNFKKDVFYKNGFSKGSEDLINLSFTLGDSDFKIHYLQDELLAIINDKGLRFNLINDKINTLYCNRNFTCEAHRFSGSKCIDITEEMFVLSLNNTIFIGGEEIKQDEIGWINMATAEKKMKIKSESATSFNKQKDAIILTISKKQ